LLSAIRSALPAAPLILLTPLLRFDKEDKAPIGMEVYRQIIFELARSSGARIFHGPELLPDAQAPGVLSDKLHPAPQGHRLLAERILSKF
jgi:lysophospholipase L1-like esterase